MCDLHSQLKDLQKDGWATPMNEVSSEKTQVEVYWRFQSKITSQHYIVSSTSFLNMNYYINNHSIAIIFKYKKQIGLVHYFFILRLNKSIQVIKANNKM